MNKLVWRKPIFCACRVRIAVALLLVVPYTVSSCWSAQAHSNKAKAVTSLLTTQTAMVKAQMPYKERLVGTFADNMVADNRTRALVRHIYADQIASIQLTGLLRGPTVSAMPSTDASNQVIVHPYFAPMVTDRRLIAHFLHALRHAYKTKGVTVSLATPSLRITFRQIGASRRDPLDININWDYFGPEFQSVLNKVPSYLAMQLHHKIPTLYGQIREVDFVTIKVTNPQEITQITRALEHVKPNAFSVYGNTRDIFGLRLLLRQGGPEEVVFVLDQSQIAHFGPSVLPKPLWTYYKQTKR